MPPSLNWPFPDAPNCPAFTTIQILEHDAPILLVSHEPDGTWQFLPGTDVNRADMKVVWLSHFLGHDHSLAQLADLPRGWQAERDALDKLWMRSPLPPDHAESEASPQT